MRTSVVVFTCDLRLTDHPPLRAALHGGGQVVPLFVRDRSVDGAGFAAPNRLAFLADCLRDLDARLRERGGRLVLREGDTVTEVYRVAAEADAGEVHMAGDVRRLRARARTVAAPCAGGRRAAPVRARHGEHRRGAGHGDVGGVSPALCAGGETEGRRRLTAWLRSGVDAYEERHDDLAGDATSRLSPHLHFGTLSPVEVVHRARRAGGAGAEAFVRQIAWRDFNRQVLAARPDAAALD
ncbi:deoxyribodipyrimidine photo-lyase [Streptomyces sp. NPDC001450]